MNEHSFIGDRLYQNLKINKKLALEAERNAMGKHNQRFLNGGEDRTRTCKRFRAVVFKTTALPIRLPLQVPAFRKGGRKLNISNSIPFKQKKSRL